MAIEDENGTLALQKIGELAAFQKNADLAKLAGVGKTVIFDIEKGKASVQLDTLSKVFDVLNIRMTFKTPFDSTLDKQP